MSELMSPTVAKIAEALAAAQGEMSGAKKDSANPFFKSKYADLAAVIGSIREPLSKHGIAHSQVPGCDAEGYYVDTLLLHTSGEWLRGRIRMNPTKEDPQGIGSVITYMRRYALQAMAGLEAEDDDGNKASEPGHPPKQALKPLPAGSFKYSEAVSTPKPAAQTTAPDKGTTGWRDVVCHIGTKGGKVNGRKLGDLGKDAVEWIGNSLAKIQSPSQADNLLKAALAMREAEMAPAPAQTELGSSRVNLEALRAKAVEYEVPLATIAAVSRTLGGASKTFEDIPEDEAGFMVAGWAETLNLSKDELPS